MKRKIKKPKANLLLVIVILITVIIISIGVESKNEDVDFSKENGALEYESESLDTITAFAERNNINMNEYPEKLLELLDKNPETKDFVFNYPLKKGKSFDIDLGEYKSSKEVPLLMQWDERWGYSEYSGGMMGLTGCGPTCLSMVCIYLLDDIELHPRYVADFAIENGYSVDGKGSAWNLILNGGKTLGLNVSEIPLVDSLIISNLKDGNPIICVMGPGDFTTEGHFIVMTAYIDGKIKINDPNSISRSEKLWNLSDIKSQIKNLWVCGR